MFEKKDTLTQYEVGLAVSYMEIYKDEVYDLFVTRENVCFSLGLSNPIHNLVSRPQNSPFERMTLEWSLWLICLASPSPQSKNSTLFISTHHLSSSSTPSRIFPRQATRNRSVGATNLNRQSSRSHAVLMVEATMIDHSNNTSAFTVDVTSLEAQSNSALTGKINLVDLAGSENNKVCPVSRFWLPLLKSDHR